MKLGVIFLAGSVALFGSTLADADDRERRSKRYDRVEHHHEHRDHQHRHRDHRREHKERKRQARKYRNSFRHPHYHGDRSRYDRDSFVGGLVLGGLAAGVYHDHYYRPYHRPYKKRRFDVSFRTNRYGECFRVEHRRHRDVYIEVPRYRCY